MRYAFSLWIDGEAGQAIRRIWRALAEGGISDLFDRIGVPPHISFAVYEEIDQTLLIAAIESFCAQAPALGVWLAVFSVTRIVSASSLSAVVTLPAVVYFLPGREGTAVLWFTGALAARQPSTLNAFVPPTFVFFANLPKALPEHYVRYVHNSLRERWGFVGSPVRIRFREN